MHQSIIIIFIISLTSKRAFPGGIVVKNSPPNAGDKDEVLIAEWGKSPTVGTANPSCILAWKIPWTEDPGGLQTMGSQRFGHY